MINKNQINGNDRAFIELANKGLLGDGSTMKLNINDRHQNIHASYKAEAILTKESILIITTYRCRGSEIEFIPMSRYIYDCKGNKEIEDIQGEA